MRSAKVLFKDEEAGILTQRDDGNFTFQYHEAWIENKAKPSIGLSLPVNGKAFHSKFLFPFFFNMLPEGPNMQAVCKLNNIDANDYFGLLVTTAKTDSIGAVRVIKMED
jgi:serine/threonine-protein kinase HipA